MDIFSAPHFRDDSEARKVLEGILWPDGPVCPHCGVIDHAYATKRAGVYRCAEKECRKDFTVTMKTVMERSKIALHKWLQAFHLMCSSKKGVSAHQLHRTLGHHLQGGMVHGAPYPRGYARWRLSAARRQRQNRRGRRNLLRQRSKSRVLAQQARPPFTQARQRSRNKRPIVALVERGGNVRTFHVPVADKDTVAQDRE